MTLVAVASEQRSAPQELQGQGACRQKRSHAQHATLVVLSLLMAVAVMISAHAASG